MQKITIYSAPKYYESWKTYKKFTGLIDEICIELKQNKRYHEIIKKDDLIKLGADVDKLPQDMDIKMLLKDIINFLNDNNIVIKETEICMTENINYPKVNDGKKSYHITMPKYCATSENIKILWLAFLEKYKIYEKILDISIFGISNNGHLYRLPEQEKGETKITKKTEGTEHTIIKGFMEDFVMLYIPENCINIDNIIESINIVIKNKRVVKKEIKQEESKEREMITKKVKKNKESMIVKKEEKEKQIYTEDENIIKNIIERCLSKERATNYETWIKVGFALKNTYDNKLGIELFDIFSKKCENKYNEKELLNYWNNIKIDCANGYTIRSLYYWAKQDKKEEFIKILQDNNYYKYIGDKLNETDIVRYIKKIEPNKFIWSQDILYCYDGNKWVLCDVEFHKFIGTVLYEHYLELIILYKIEDSDFIQIKKKLNRLKTLSFKKDIVATSKEVFTNNKIEFDMNGSLIGFENGIYDLEKDEFRKYNYNDYITFTTKHNFYEKYDEKKMEEVKNFINSFMPDPEIQKLYLEILATGLEGRTLQKFIIFNGSGGNGKSLMDEYMEFLLGDYAYTDCPSALLTEKQSTNGNPAKYKLNKKRFVCIKEPDEDVAFQNTIIKELTGGNKISGRNLNSNNTDIHLHITLIVEANSVPLLRAEPTDAELRRYIDLLFPYKFTDNEAEIDNVKCFKANNIFKTHEWKNQHKNEMYHLLLKNYKDYKNNNYDLKIPQKVRERTEAYLEKSFTIMNFFNETYTITNNIEDFVKINDIIEDYKNSEDYKNLNKESKRKLSKDYFINFFKNNNKFSKHYCERKRINGIDYRNIICNYKNIISEIF